jgi:hypothetical protein
MTDYLFAKPSFLEGMARALDLGGTLSVYNESPTPDLADALAIRLDWQSVKADMVQALSSFAADHDEED